jgi:DNA-binding IclR family transcriptional regulator
MEAIPRVTDATLDVLRELARAAEPTWGLQVIAATGRPAGSVYPILSRLEQRGWLTSAWEEGERRGPRRRLYALTDAARPAVHALLAERRTATPSRLDWSLS